MADFIEISTDRVDVITVGGVTEEIITTVTDVITIDGVGLKGDKGDTGTGGTWGSITGTLSDQTDLKNQQDTQDSAIALNTAKVTFPEAPEDGSQYARKNAGWEIVSADVDSVNGKTGVVVLDTDDIDDSTQINKYTTAGDISKIAGIEAGAQVNTVDSVNAKTGIVVINPDDLDDSATVNKFVTAAQITVIDNTSGVNTGDQDISGIATNAADIATINDDAIFSDPTSPKEIDFGWLGTRTEYDALPSKTITKFYLLNSDFPFLSSVVVSGQTPVNITDSEIYTATVDSNAPDLTYLWTATGTTDATINGSATGSTVTIDYTGTPGDPDSFADIKCVVSSVDVGSSVEDTLQVTVEHVGVINWTQDFSLLDPPTDVVYGIDPAVTTWIDKGTSLTNLTQTTVANQADLVAGEMVFDTSGTYDFYEGVIAHPSDFSYYFEVSLVGTSGNSVFRSNSYDSFVNIRIDLDLLRFRSGALAINDVDLTGTTYSVLNKFLIRRENDVFSVFLNGSNIGGFTDVGGEYLFETLSSDVSGLTGSFKNMSNINRALTDQEAIDETTPDGIQWTQDFSLLDPITDVVYGIDPAVTTWIDKGTSLTNLTQTTVASQPDLLTGAVNSMDFSAGSRMMTGLDPNSGSFTYLFEILDGTNTTTQGFIYPTVGGSQIMYMSSSSFIVNDQNGANYIFGSAYLAGNHKYAIRLDGASLSFWRDGSQVGASQTVTGALDLFDRIGRNTSISHTQKIVMFKNIDRALTDAEAIAETT